ncbi:MAG: hypothetical protein ACI9BV_003783 [Rhodothermales bacterium]|jgi:hypothetical protein
MSSEASRWILVTGLPRSGTTFLGMVLSAGLRGDYIHEPFNPSCGIAEDLIRYPCLDAWARDKEHETARLRLAELMAFRAKFRLPRYPEDSSYRRAIRGLVGGRGQLNYRLAKINLFATHAVLKDPTAFLMADFLAKEGPMNPLVVLRHPLSWIGAWLRTGWAPELQILQDRHRFVASLTDGERSLLLNEGSLGVRLARFWRLAYGRLLRQAKAHGWTVVKLEDASSSPDRTFQALYTELGLPWGIAARRLVKRMTGGSGVDGEAGHLQDMRRASGQIFQARKDAVPAEWRRDVFAITHDLAGEYYPDSSYE